jgi:hypothetical protein
MYRQFWKDLEIPLELYIPPTEPPEPWPPLHCKFSGTVNLVDFSYFPVSGPTGPYQRYLIQWNVEGPPEGWTLQMLNTEGEDQYDPAPFIGSHITQPIGAGTYVLKVTICGQQEQILGRIDIPAQLDTCYRSTLDYFSDYVRQYLGQEAPDVSSLRFDGSYFDLVRVKVERDYLDIRMEMTLEGTEANPPKYEIIMYFGLGTQYVLGDGVRKRIRGQMRYLVVRSISNGSGVSAETIERVRRFAEEDMITLMRNFVNLPYIQGTPQATHTLYSVAIVPTNTGDRLIKWYCPLPVPQAIAWDKALKAVKKAT